MTKTINKSQFIKNIALNCGHVHEALIEESVKEILYLMVDTLANDGRVEVRGFGTLCLNHRKARLGRNPKSGEKVAIPAKAIPHFKPGKALRKAVKEVDKD